jgi:hypothetical protein
MLGAAAAFLLLAGCSTVGQSSSKSRSAGLSPSASQSSNQAGVRGKKPANESSSWLGSWFKPKEPEPPKTIQEYMRQPRPALPPAA